MRDNTFHINAAVPSVPLRIAPRRTEHAAPPALLVTVTDVDLAGATIRVTGQLDLAAVDILTEVLDAQLDAGRIDVRIDVSDVAFCSCAGLGSLLASRHRFAAAGGTLTLIGLDGCVGRLLRLTDLELVPELGRRAPPRVC